VQTIACLTHAKTFINFVLQFTNADSESNLDLDSSESTHVARLKAWFDI
jgi:hypothetical protein